MGPLEATKPWSMEGVNGVRGFLDRVWRMIVNERGEQLELIGVGAKRRADGRAKPRAAQDDSRRDARSRADGLQHGDRQDDGVHQLLPQVRDAPRAAMETLVLLLSPLAPHIAEELWQLLGHDTTLAYEPWPAFDPAAVHEDTIEVPVQIKGKLRARIMVPLEASEAELERLARCRSTDRGIARWSSNRQSDRRQRPDGELRHEINRGALGKCRQPNCRAAGLSVPRRITQSFQTAAPRTRETAMRNVITLVLGGGRGTRLYPLTKYRSKPAVPLAGKYRLIDIPLSNCINSGLNRIYVLTQFNSVSLHRHIRRAYAFDQFSAGFVEILAAQQTLDTENWYQGTADAVRQNLRYIDRPDVSPRVDSFRRPALSDELQ